MSYDSEPPSTSVTLIAHLRKCADPAWRTFVDLYTPLVYGYCRQRGLQDADAKDVTQNVFSQVSKAIHTFEYDPKRGQFRSWLGTIVAHAISKQLQMERRQHRCAVGAADHETALLTIANDGADSAWVEEFNTQILTTALAITRREFDLPTWRAFELTWMEDQKPQAAAAELGRPVPWIYKAKFKVLARLKEQVLFLADDAAILGKG